MYAITVRKCPLCDTPFSLKYRKTKKGEIPYYDWACKHTKKELRQAVVSLKYQLEEMCERT